MTEDSWSYFSSRELFKEEDFRGGSLNCGISSGQPKSPQVEKGKSAGLTKSGQRIQRTGDS